MHIQEFKYQKAGSIITEEKHVLVLKEDNTYLEGVDLSKLQESERVALTALVEAMNKILTPVINQSYRRYRKDMVS